MATGRQKYFVTRKDRKVEHLPWGPHDWLSRPDIVDTRDILVVRVNMPKGESQDFHKQPAMEEVIYILEGKAEQWVDREMRIVGPGDLVHVPRGVAHATVNVGGGVLRFLSIFSPARAPGAAWVDVSAEEPWLSLREASWRQGSGAARARAIQRHRSSGVRTAAQKRAAQKKAAGKRGGGKVVRKSGRAAKTTRRKPPKK